MNIRHRLAVEKADVVRREYGIGWSEEYKEEILEVLSKKGTEAIRFIVYKSVSEIQYEQIKALKEGRFNCNEI